MFKRAKARNKPAETKVTHLYHGIEVATGSNPCAAARAVVGRRFLSEESPLLPLQACDHPLACDCKYKHFVDRRTDARRESDSGLPQRDHAEEKRGQTGRRITDD